MHKDGDEEDLDEAEMRDSLEAMKSALSSKPEVDHTKDKQCRPKLHDTIMYQLNGRFHIGVVRKERKQDCWRSVRMMTNNEMLQLLFNPESRGLIWDFCKHVPSSASAFQRQSSSSPSRKPQKISSGDVKQQISISKAASKTAQEAEQKESRSPKNTKATKLLPKTKAPSKNFEVASSATARPSLQLLEPHASAGTQSGYHGVLKSSSSAEEATIGWRTNGHEWIGQNVLRIFDESSIAGSQMATVTGWVAAEGSEEALWHVVRTCVRVCV